MEQNAWVSSIGNVFLTVCLLKKSKTQCNGNRRLCDAFIHTPTFKKALKKHYATNFYVWCFESLKILRIQKHVCHYFLLMPLPSFVLAPFS